MAFPASVQTVTVTLGPLLDATGNPEKGRFFSATLAQQVRILDSGAILPGKVTTRTDALGVATLTLAASDSQGLDVSGFTYRIKAHGRPDADVSLPAAVPSVRVEDLVPVEPSTGVVVWVPPTGWVLDTDLATVATTGDYTDLEGAPTLATVATTGVYTDLTARPTLGTAAAAATTDFATAAQGVKADNAQPRNFPPITPVTVTYPEQTRADRRVLFQTGSTYYACLQSTAGTIYKSTDNGATWTTLAGALGYEPSTLLRVRTTGTLIAIGANPTPTLSRSTDDGATWTTITGALAYAPLGDCGLVETPSGYILIAEYGNVANTSYRVRRSTDDGATWTTVLSSPGTDAATDPGHIHSVTYDKIQNRFVAVMDRPTMEHYYSDDQGATWTQIPGAGGDSTTWPNWVTPMYFADHIAWGYDTPLGARIARLPRADYYAGAWGNVETVAELHTKAAYDTFPLADDVWMIGTATEQIGTAANTPGAYATETHVVYSGGSRVVGALVHSTPTVTVNAMTGHRPRFPNREFDVYNHSRRSWINLPTTGVPYAFAAVPYTVATSMRALQTAQAPHGPLIIHSNSGVWSRDTAGGLRQVFYMNTNNQVSMRNPYSTATPEIRLMDSATGVIGFYFNSARVGAFVSDGRLLLDAGKYLQLSDGGPRVYGGAGTPEGVQAAPVGSLWLRSNGGAGTTLYVKESGTGTAGWVPK